MARVPPSLSITIVDSVAEFNVALDIRYAVFCDEQGIPREIELDAEDAFSTHVLVRDGSGRAIATGRVMRQRTDGTLHALSAKGADSDLARIGRMAVRPEGRRAGIGGTVLLALEAEAAKAGLQRAVLHAQMHAQPFYSQHGYRPQGEVFEEAGIPHIAMVKAIGGR